jgi:hypothetical protein
MMTEKSEGRNPKEARSPKGMARLAVRISASDFGF